MNRTFRIQPYVGVEDLTFGMTTEEVGAVLGPPVRSLKNRKGGVEEVREGVKVCYSPATQTSTDFVLFPPAQAVYYGVDLLASSDPVSVLIPDDPAPLESMGIVVFLRLGLTVTGFDEPDEADKAVTVFMEGRWDALREDLKPYLRVNDE